MESPINYFSSLTDPRVERTREHSLEDILFIAIDGKSMRGSRSSDKKSIVHMVSAWAEKNHIVLGQVKVDEKSNEITAIPKLLDLLVLKGCIVTIDAMGTIKLPQAKQTCLGYGLSLSLTIFLC